jgi:hypothetical protein
MQDSNVHDFHVTGHEMPISKDRRLGFQDFFLVNMYS